MPCKNGQTKPMQNAAKTGKRKSQHHLRVERVMELPDVIFAAMCTPFCYDKGRDGRTPPGPNP